MAAALVSVVAIAVACQSDSEVATTDTYPVEAEVVFEELVGPTQLAVAADGSWYVAQLNGDENDSHGQVLRVDPTDPELAPEVIVDGLDKPTGVAIFGGDLWIMERRRLTRGRLDGSARHVVIDELPFNGRSEGALTVDGDRLLFDTSGQIADGAVVADSGTLWSVDTDETITPIATGFKHAYAQTRTGDGTLLSTEIADGRYDGEIPADELVAVVEGTDHGWPRCVGDNIPVAEYGGVPVAEYGGVPVAEDGGVPVAEDGGVPDADDGADGVTESGAGAEDGVMAEDGGGAEPCAQLPASYAVFAPGATPTGIAAAPWDRDIVLVALWNHRQVVAVDGAGRVRRVSLTVDRPQHLTVDGDGVLLTDHGAGTIVRLTAPTAG